MRPVLRVQPFVTIRSQGLASVDWSRISAKEAIELARVIDRLLRRCECLKLAAEKAGGLRKLLSAVPTTLLPQGVSLT